MSERVYVVIELGVDGLPVVESTHPHVEVVLINHKAKKRDVDYAMHGFPVQRLVMRAGNLSEADAAVLSNLNSTYFGKMLIPDACHNGEHTWPSVRSPYPWRMACIYCGVVNGDAMLAAASERERTHGK